jgi:hypothetical protein
MSTSAQGLAQAPCNQLICLAGLGDAEGMIVGAMCLSLLFNASNQWH